MFWLKKLVSYWLMPLPFCLALLVVGVALALFPKTRRLGRILGFAGTALLLLFSNRAVSNALIRPLEAMYPPIPEIDRWNPAPAEILACRYVVVLGSGNSYVPGMAATGKLTPSGLERIVEAVRLLRVMPQARLVLSGPSEYGLFSHATILTKAAESLGIDASRITRIETARDTEDEARAMAKIAGKDRVCLVTSAWHMPRAARLFKDAGVAFVACPADFATRDSLGPKWRGLGLDSESIERSTLAVHEWLGLLWLDLRGLG